MMAVVVINHGSKPEAHEETARMRVVACMRLLAIPVAREQSIIWRCVGQNRAVAPFARSMRLITDWEGKYARSPRGLGIAAIL